MMTSQTPRAIFSTEDFGLLREAIAAYLRQIDDDSRSSKYVSLHHRLGRGMPKG